MSRFDPEQAALQSGLKPALRLRPPHTQLTATGARYRAAGFAVLEHRDTIYVARSEHDCDELCELEARLRRDIVGTRRAREQRRIGALLGYPPCCIEAFVDRYVAEPNQLVAWLARRPAEIWRAARAAWVAAPRPRLNTLLGGEGTRIVSFEPCRFDCAAASAQADAIFDVLSAADRERAAELDRRLAEDVVVLTTGACATLRLEQGRIEEVFPCRSDVRRSLSRRDHALLLSLIGARVGFDGWLMSGSHPRPVVVEFGASRRGAD